MFKVACGCGVVCFKNCWSHGLECFHSVTEGSRTEGWRVLGFPSKFSSGQRSMIFQIFGLLKALVCLKGQFARPKHQLNPPSSRDCISREAPSSCAGFVDGIRLGRDVYVMLVRRAFSSKSPWLIRMVIAVD